MKRVASGAGEKAWTKNWAYAVKLLVSVAAVYYVFDRFDLSNIGLKLVEQDGELFVVAVLVTMTQILAAGLRWHVILEALGMSRPVALVLRIFYGTAFLNSFLPAGIAGDAVRVWLVRDKTHGLAVALSSVLVDRIVTLLTLVGVASVAQTFLWVERGEYGFFFLTVAIGMALVIGILGTIWVGSVLPSRAPHRFLTLLFDLVNTVGHAIRLLATSRALLVTVGIALTGNLLLLTALYVLGRGQSMELGFGTCLVAMPLVLLVAALPISIGGWGTRELAMVYMLSLFDIPADQATSLSVSFGICSTIASLPGAAVWVLYRRVPPQVEEQG